MTEFQLNYAGPPALASAFAQVLEEHGVTASYEPPFETKDLATAMAVVSVAFSVLGSPASIRESIRVFTDRFGNASVEGLPEQPEESIENRLGRVDDLLSRGMISHEEHARQRSRILDEL